MGWVSCLEDTQERLDDILNTIQGLSTNVGDSTSYEISRMRQDLHDLQSQLDNLVNIVTDPDIGSKIELHELKEVYEQTKLQNQQLQQQLSEVRRQCGEQLKEIEETNRQLSEMAKSLKAEQDIAEHATAECYKEQQRCEKLETKLQTFKQPLKKVYQDENGLNQKKHSKRR